VGTGGKVGDIQNRERKDHCGSSSIERANKRHTRAQQIDEGGDDGQQYAIYGGAAESERTCGQNEERRFKEAAPVGDDDGKARSNHNRNHREQAGILYLLRK
jgi:hypothetical protein